MNVTMGLLFQQPKALLQWYSPLLVSYQQLYFVITSCPPKIQSGILSYRNMFLDPLFLPLFSNTTVTHDGQISQACCLLEIGGHREKNATDREKRMWMTLLHFLFHSMTLFLFKLQTLDKEEHGKCSTFQILIFLRLSPILTRLQPFFKGQFVWT